MQNDAGGSYQGKADNEDGFSAGVTLPDLDDGPLFDFRLAFNAPADGAPYFDQGNDIFEATFTADGLTVSDFLTRSAPNPIAAPLAHDILVGGSVAGRIEFSGTTDPVLNDSARVVNLELSIADGLFRFDESHVINRLGSNTRWDLTTGVLNNFILRIANPEIGGGQINLDYLDPASEGIDLASANDFHTLVLAAVELANADCQISGSTNAQCSGVIPVPGSEPGPFMVSLRAVQLAPGAGGGYFAGGGNLNVPAGMPVDFNAIGAFDDGSTRIITEEVIWVSSDTSVGVFDTENPGQLHTLTSAAGLTTDVKAKTTNTDNVEIETETVTVHVTSASLRRVFIQPVGGVVLGETRQYTATGLFGTGDLVDYTDRVTWSSSDTAVATVSNAAGTKGQVTGVMTGTTNITIIDPQSGEQDVQQIIVSQE